ncbi:MAG: response regulator [Deltaproteobacteria bacterium]|nr:response regulator [Deltaproteobacteria bacterium]
MIIQCPECKSRYRTRVFPDGPSPLSVKCPKCTHQFLVAGEAAAATAEVTDLPTILLVDDARFFRELIVDLLKERRANLLTADSAAAAWEKLHKQKVRLLVVDINLPDKNGLELIREIREDATLSGLSILCISGVHRREDDALAAIRAGADDFISKSFKPDELNRRIDKLLDK